MAHDCTPAFGIGKDPPSLEVSSCDHFLAFVHTHAIVLNDYSLQLFHICKLQKNWNEI